jgi:hypothetical protein
VQQLSLEVAAHLEEHREVTLFCFDSGGHPIGYPMMITGVRGTELLFSTYSKSAKVRHMREDPRVAVLSVAADDPTHLRWVSLRGTATIWQPTAEEIDLIFPLARSQGRMADGRVPDSVGPLVRQRTLEGKRAIVRVVPEDPADLRIERTVR